jgi:hypothetical protein
MNKFFGKPQLGISGVFLSGSAGKNEENIYYIGDMKFHSEHLYTNPHYGAPYETWVATLSGNFVPEMNGRTVIISVEFPEERREYARIFSMRTSTIYRNLDTPIPIKLGGREIQFQHCMSTGYGAQLERKIEECAVVFLTMDKLEGKPGEENIPEDATGYYSVNQYRKRVMGLGPLRTQTAQPNPSSLPSRRLFSYD